MNDATAPAVVNAAASNPIQRRREDERGPRRPPVPSDANLRHFPKVPILAQRLFDSRFNSIANDPEFRAGVNLWLKSWYQIPAGSLPADDVELCRLSGYGINLQGWHMVKAVALHGWYHATDGRMYHKVIAEVVNEALEVSRKQSEKAVKRWAGHTKKTPGDKSGKSRTKKKKSDTKTPDAAAMPGAALPRREMKGEEGKVSTSSTALGLSTPVSADSAPEKPADETQSTIFMQYPLVSRDDEVALLDITDADVDRWAATYPLVDVKQVLRELLLWANDSPTKRKTRAHAPHHIASCLAKRQRARELDSYRGTPAAPAAPATPDYAAGTANNRRSFLDVDD